MKHRKRRWGSAERFLSILLAVVMVLSLAPENMLTLAAYAEERAIEESVEKNTTEEPVDESTTGESTEEDPSEGGDMEKPSEGEDTEKPAGSDVEKPSEGEDTENPVGESDVEEPSEGETTENPARENDEEKPADAEEGLCPHHEQHTEDCGYGETTPCGYECKICPVQDLIDALPDGSEITAENAADVEKQLAEIDEAKAELTDEELDELDTARYEAAVSALLVLEDMKGANVPELLATNYDVSTGNVVISADGDYTITGTTTSNTITVESGVNATITLNNVNIDVSSNYETAAFGIADNSTGNVTITLEGTNTLKSGGSCAGLQKNGGSGTLTIIGTGSLTATGGNFGAGIGGGDRGSGTGITISGGEVTAKGGASGAGIGGGSGGGGTITITGGTVTATGGHNGAGIGGGNNGNGGIIKISGGKVEATGNNSAGIGGGNNGNGGNITISGGEVTAKGGASGAGIGGGYGGSGGDITISGGTVKANGDSYGAGIGNGGYGGTGGKVTISGGIVTATGGNGAGIGNGSNGSSGCTFSTGTNGSAWIIATSGKSGTSGISDNGNTTGWNGSIFQNGAGQVYGNSYTLTANAEIPSGATLTVDNGQTLTIARGANITGGTITGGGTFLTENLTADMISVPTNLVYNGNDRSEDIKTALENLTATICNQAFQITGWSEPTVETTDNFSYTVTYTPTDGGEAVTKTVSLGKSGTILTATLADNKTEYAYTDNITINATVKASGETANAPAMLTATFGEPAAGQVAVYEGSNLVCAAQTPNADGACTFSIPARELGAGEHTLTVKYIESSVMAEATVNVNVLNVAECTHPTMENGKCTVCGETIVARIVVGSDNAYYTSIEDAWTFAVSAKQEVTVILENNAKTDKTLTVPSGADITLKGSSHTLTCTSGLCIDVTGGTLNISSGTYTGSSALSVSGGNVTLSGGTFSKITTSGGKYLGDLLTEEYSYKVNIEGHSSWFMKQAVAARTEFPDSYSSVEVLKTPVRNIQITSENAEVIYGYTAENAPTLTVTATTIGTPTYQWWELKENESLKNEIDGATGATYSPIGLSVGEHKFGCTISLDGLSVLSICSTITVNPKPLTITSATLAEKTYDGENTATVTGVTFDGVLSGENLAISTDYTATAEFADANAGTNKSATVTVTLKDKNYSLEKNTFTIISAEIKPKTLAAGEITVDVNPDSYEYAGSAITPETVKVTYTEGGKTIVIPDSEYSVTYKDNTDIGNATVTVSDEGQNSGNYEFTDVTTTFKITAVSISKAEVTVKGDYIYNGTAQTPDGKNVTVTLNERTLTAETDYTIAVTDNVNAGTATVTVTGKGNYKDTATATFTIAKAPLTITAKAQSITYGGSITQGTAQVNTEGLVSGHTLESVTLTPSSNEVETKDKTITPSASKITNNGTDVTANYDITYKTGKLTIEYFNGTIPVKFTANGNELAETAWVSPATKVTISASGFTVAAVDAGGTRPTADKITESGITMPADEVKGKTFYFRQNDTGHMTDGIQYTLNIDDNPPSGSIELKYKFWDSFLSVISFGHYQATDKTVTITATDNESGIKTTEYVIVTGGTSYATKKDLEAAGLSWQSYDSGKKPTIGVNTPSVIYAKLTDNAGNVTYLSSDGILMDTEAPKISSFNIAADSVTDEKAQMSITVDETAAIYLVAVPTAEAGGIQAKDVIATCDVNAIGAADGTPIADAIVAWKGMLAADGENPTGTKDITGLAPSTAYTVYAVAVDKVIDMDNSTNSKIVYTGNVSPLSSTTFTTKKAQPVIAKKPILSGTYGQTIGTMLTDGTAKDKNGAVLAGTWTVSTADQNKTPSVGTTEEITVTFTPDDAAYDTISVKITPGVSPRSLSAEGVVISQVAGIYTYDNGTEIKPPVALGSGIPTEGIYISDSGAVLAASDFTISYSDNKNAGTATVTITGRGNYTGSVTREFTIKKAAGRVVPGLTGTETQEKDTYTYTITPIEGAVYRMGDGAWTKVGQENANIFTGITPGTSVKFSAKIPGDTNHEDGPEKDIIVNFEKLTPAAPALSYTRSTDEGTGKVTITITPVKGAQYSFDGGTTWEDANVKEYPDGSGQVALAIRLKETDTHKESPVQTVTVDLSKEDRGAPEPFTLQYAPNGETDYTVTIPPTEGCEYSFDGVTWSDENVKTGVAAGETVTGYKRYKETNQYNASGAVSDTETMPKFTVKTPVISPAGGAYTGSVGVTITCGTSGAQIYYTTDGSTPTRSSIRYTGAFTVTPTITVKAIAIKEGLEASAVVTASYTKPGGGSSGGGDSGNDDNDSDGGSGNSSGQESGSNGGSAGNKASAAPTDSPSADTKPGSDTPQKDKEPFIKGKNGKIGWDVIRAEEEKTKDGNTINVDMNGSAVVPGDIFDRLRGRDIIITFDMGNDILWSVDGKSITRDASQGRIGDIDFSVKTGANTIPVDVINNVTGESYSIQLSLAHEGEFGFTAVLSIGLGRENAGYTASLYYYNESAEKLEFICKDKIAEDGTASLAFTHASDYVIMIGEEEESCAAMKPAQQENTGGNAGNDNAAAGGNAADTEGAPAEESLKDGQENKTVWPIAAGIIALAAAALAGMLAWRKKKEDK